MINLAETIGETLGMAFNPPKCALLPVPFNKDIQPPIVNGQSIGLVSKGKPYKYLGTKRTFFRNIDIKDILKKCLKETKLIIDSDLHPHQKVHAYNTFIHSQLPFHLRHGRIPLSNFTTNSDQAPAYDPAIRQLMIRNFGLIKGAPVDFFYVSKEAGGAQIYSALDEYFIQSIVYILRLVNNSDPRLISAIKNDLIRHLRTKNLNFDNFESGIRFLNTDHNNFTHLSKTEWVRIQIARQQLKKLYDIDTTVSFSVDNLTICFIMGNDVLIINSANRTQMKSIHESLAAFIRLAHLIRLQKHSWAKITFVNSTHHAVLNKRILN